MKVYFLKDIKVVGKNYSANTEFQKIIFIDHNNIQQIEFIETKLNEIQTDLG